MRAFIPILLLGALASSASAEGLHLRWRTCATDGGETNKAFACNTNTQSHVLVPSIVLSSPVTLTSAAVTIDFVAAASTLPAWWDFNQCRSGSIRAVGASAIGFTCEFTGCALGINWFVIGSAGPNTARVQLGGLRCSRTLVAGTEYVVPALAINSTRTLGSPSCEGCATGVCISLASVRLNDIDYTTPAAPGSSMVTWQGGGSGPGGSCQAVTAARRTVWGAVKALYR